MVSTVVLQVKTRLSETHHLLNFFIKILLQYANLLINPVCDLFVDLFPLQVCHFEARALRPHRPAAPATQDEGVPARESVLRRVHHRQ